MLQKHAKNTKINILKSSGHDSIASLSNSDYKPCSLLLPNVRLRSGCSGWVHQSKTLSLNSASLWLNMIPPPPLNWALCVFLSCTAAANENVFKWWHAKTERGSGALGGVKVEVQNAPSSSLCQHKDEELPQSKKSRSEVSRTQMQTQRQTCVLSLPHTHTHTHTEYLEKIPSHKEADWIALGLIFRPQWCHTHTLPPIMPHCFLPLAVPLTPPTHTGAPAVLSQLSEINLNLQLGCQEVLIGVICPLCVCVGANKRTRVTLELESKQLQSIVYHPSSPQLLFYLLETCRVVGK